MLGLNVGFLSIISSIVSGNVTIFYSSIDGVRFLLFARSSNGRTYIYTSLQLTPVPLNRSFRIIV